MRIRHCLALAATVGAAAPAAAQTRSEGRTESIYRAPDIRIFSRDGDELEHRAALGISTTATGTLRDTLGLMVTGVTKGGPVDRAGVEEGNRIAAINGVSLRASAADIEDYESSGALSRRLTRELSKFKPGDEVELRVYRDGRTSTVKVRTADSDSLFRRTELTRRSRLEREREMEDRPVLGIGIGSTGSRRDTLGVLIASVGDSTPAERAGLEEGNRIAAINGVSLRVAREDAGDPFLGNAKAQRLQREIGQLKPGTDVTLRIYANGQFRDVRVKVARAADLPRRRNTMMFMGDGFGGPFPAIAPMAPMAPMAPRAPMPSTMRIMRAQRMTM